MTRISFVRIKALVALLVAPAIIAMTLASAACGSAQRPRTQVLEQSWCDCLITVEVVEGTVTVLDVEDR